MPKDDTTQPVTSSQPLPTSGLPPAAPITEEISPPMIHDITTTSVQTVTPASTTTNTGSAAPTGDVVMPQTVITSTPKKKFAGGKVIATLLGLFLLVGGLGAGIFLVKQNQNVGEKAATLGCDNVTCDSNEVCRGDGNCVWVGNEDDPKRDDRIEQIQDPVAYNQRCLYLTGPECGGGDWCTAEFASDCALWSPPDVPDEPNPTPTPPPVTASCQNVKAYDSQGVLLTSPQLSALKAGTSIIFCVSGIASDGTFDKAEFTINGDIQPVVTTEKPPLGWCKSYVIPAATTTFNVSARLHHVTLGWK